MSEAVKRYDISGYGGGMIEAEEGVWYHEDDYARLEQECARLRGDIELALKVPSVAAMHTYLGTECAKQNVQLAAERDAALKQVEGLRAILAEARVMTFLVNSGQSGVLRGQIDAALRPAQCAPTK